MLKYFVLVVALIVAVFCATDLNAWPGGAGGAGVSGVLTYSGFVQVNDMRYVDYTIDFGVPATPSSPVTIHRQRKNSAGVWIEEDSVEMGQNDRHYAVSMFKSCEDGVSDYQVFASWTGPQGTECTSNSINW